MKHIFISHAGADVEIAKAMRAAGLGLTDSAVREKALA